MSNMDRHKRLSERFRNRIAFLAAELDGSAFELGHRLIDAGFLEAPASTSHHLAYEGGLAEHSLNVADALEGLVYDRTGGEDAQGRSRNRLDAICDLVGILHDLCKLDCYERGTDGAWTWVPHTRGDCPPEMRDSYAHGELSQIYARSMLEGLPLWTEALEPSERSAIMAAIRYHMGLFDAPVLALSPERPETAAPARDAMSAYLTAASDCPLVALTHVADMVATHAVEGDATRVL